MRAHKCQPDKDGYCGSGRYICAGCGHKGMEYSGMASRKPVLMNVKCPKCGRTVKLPEKTEAGMKV